MILFYNQHLASLVELTGLDVINVKTGGKFTGIKGYRVPSGRPVFINQCNYFPTQNIIVYIKFNVLYTVNLFPIEALKV